jgi:two-component system response regulator YesN
MIRVLVVDDDKLVRKGLISSMPWKQFRMDVVGEANNGENALKFMETNKVDLLLTDLSMPVMSGIELMREVRQRYPHIKIVVLTLHQDFEYVQEALRLGAIDYIAKTQLESEQFEEVLGRIAALMEQRDPLKGTLVQQDEIEQADEVFVLYSLHQQSDEAKSDIVLPERAIEVDAGVWYWTDVLPGSFSPNPNYALICFRNLQGLDRKSVLRLIRDYRKCDLFYDHDPLQPYQIVHKGSVSNCEKADTGQEIDKIKEQWISYEWIYDDDVFGLMKRELQRIKLPPGKLARNFYSLADEWNRLYRQILLNPILIEDFFSSWVQFESWLLGTRETIRLSNAKPLYSQEIHRSIVKAVNLAQQMMNQPLNAGDIANRVNMSSSYFSQCFKQIVGQTYTDYVRDIRMERAKEYLSSTAKTIQWIAEQVGYSDEKYFSRLFREQVGMLPSEYRQTVPIEGPK